MTTASSTTCRVCESAGMRVIRETNLDPQSLKSSSFAITDSSYGTTGDLAVCAACGFIQCVNVDDVLAHYQALEDPEYETGRAERALQARKLLDKISAYQPSGRLLDVGAGSGILVEEALTRGYRAEGIEPSRWLQQRAADRHLPVKLGSLPDPTVTGPFDVVTFIDVIEHVSDPVALLQTIEQLLAPNGVLAVVTPDVGSVAARLLGFRWWHYRVAHIGYFNRSNLARALERAGLHVIGSFRPSWYFTAKYLLERVNKYLPRPLALPTNGFWGRPIVPLNLFDSILAIARKRSA